MRFHLPALPGQPITKENSVCAFTQKVRKFANMMVPRGHEIFIYGDPEHDSLATEHIACYPSCDPPEFTPEAWEEYNSKVAPEIIKRAEANDFLGLMGGRAQEQLVPLLPHLTPVEYGIGYGGAFAPFKVFESYAWMHTVYGEQRGSNTADGSFYDAVIPAYFEVEDFPYRVKKKDYLLYVGRLTERKGIQVVEEVGERLGCEVKFAGAGDYEPKYGECLGNVQPKQRGKLMSEAKALICPTIYVEPFGCIAVEAQMCGTPVLSTDWGAFVETVQHGVTGYRCRTLSEFVWAAENVGRLDPRVIRSFAVENYSLEAIAPQYEAYFEQLVTLQGEGWYSKDPRPVPHRGVIPPRP